MLIRPATPDDAAGIAAVRRVSWPAAYAGIMDPQAIAQVVAQATAERERASFTERPWRHLLVAENPPGPAEDPAVARAAVITGYASFGTERSVDGLPRSPRAATGRGPEPRPLAAELYALYVAPAHWSTGTGRALMEQVLATVRAEGQTRIILWVLRDNQRARRFYARAGFRRRGREHPSFAGAPEVRYERDLLPAAGPPLT